MEEGEISPSLASTSSSSDTEEAESSSKSSSPASSIDSETVPMESQPIIETDLSCQEQQHSEQEQIEQLADLEQVAEKLNGTNGEINSESTTSKEQQQKAKLLKQEKKQKKKKRTFTDPVQIVESVLAKSSFKVPNLSQIVEQKFYQAQDYRTELKQQLSDIIYEPTVGATVDGYSDVNISVLPFGFEQGEVNLSASAIMNLPCIYEKTPHRKKNKGKGKKNPNQQRQQKAANSKNDSSTKEGREKLSYPAKNSDDAEMPAKARESQQV